METEFKNPDTVVGATRSQLGSGPRGLVVPPAQPVDGGDMAEERVEAGGGLCGDGRRPATATATATATAGKAPELDQAALQTDGKEPVVEGPVSACPGEGRHAGAEQRQGEGRPDSAAGDGPELHGLVPGAGGKLVAEWVPRARPDYPLVRFLPGQQLTVHLTS